MLNQVQLIGNLGAGPEVKTSAAGQVFVTFSLATTEKWTDKAGARKEATEWHRVVVFAAGLCSVAEKYLKKGSKVFVQGRLQTKKWTDDQGVERWSTEVVLPQVGGKMVLLGDAKGGHRPPEAPAPTDLDDGIPF